MHQTKYFGLHFQASKNNIYILSTPIIKNDCFSSLATCKSGGFFCPLCHHLPCQSLCDIPSVCQTAVANGPGAAELLIRLGRLHTGAFQCWLASRRLNTAHHRRRCIVSSCTAGQTRHFQTKAVLEVRQLLAVLLNLQLILLQNDLQFESGGDKLILWCKTRILSPKLLENTQVLHCNTIIKRTLAVLVGCR